MKILLPVTPADAQKRVKDEHSLATQRTKYPNWYKRWTEKLGRTEQDFANLAKFVAEWQEEAFRTSPLGPLAPLASTTDIDVPEGAYFMNYPVDIGYADYMFGGTFVYYPGNGSTNCLVWHEEWMGGIEKDLFRTAMFATDLAGSYAESMSFQNVRLVGRAAKAILSDPSYKSVGAIFWDLGETSKVDRIYAEGFNNRGLRFVRGTPGQGDNLTVFNNCDGGIHLVGCAGATFDFGTISGDDNGALLEMEAGYGRESGGEVDVDAFKSEAGVTPIDRNPHRKQKLMVLRGQFGVVGGVANASHNQVRVDDLIEVDCRLQDGTKQVSNIVFGSIRGFNYGNLIKDIANGWTAADPGDFQCFSFQYTSANGGALWNPFHTFTKVPTGTTPPVDPPPVDPPPAGSPKDKRTYTTATTGPTTAATRVITPQGVNPIASIKLVNVKFKALPAAGQLAWVNAALFIGVDGLLWTIVNGVMKATTTKPVVNQAINVSIPAAGASLAYVIGSGNGPTAQFTGTVELY